MSSLTTGRIIAREVKRLLFGVCFVSCGWLSLGAPAARAEPASIPQHILWYDEETPLGEVKVGSYYKVQGRLIAGTDRAHLVVEKLEATPIVPLSIADFVDREATLEGFASPGGKLKIDSDSAQVAGVTDWPAEISRKRLAVRGLIRGSKDAWQIERPEWKLVELKDQLDQDVCLTGFRPSPKAENFSRDQDGVPLLVAKHPVRAYYFGSPTTAGRFMDRNSKAIGAIVREATPKSRDILARRMNDAYLPEALRLVYAAVLALDAIARPGSEEAVKELIGLLSVDLARFGSDAERVPLQKLKDAVATHLIELTGESFGTDAETWRKWHESQQKTAVPQ
jgi:hypothetical protein